MSKKLTISDQRQLRKFKLYSDAEFRGLKGANNRQERLLAAVLDDREALLSDTDFRYLELLKRAFRVMTSTSSSLTARMRVAKLLEVSSRARVKQIMSDVQLIFMDNEDRNEAFDRQVFEHKVGRLIDRLERHCPMSKSLPELYKLLAKVRGYDKPEGVNWEDIELPIPVYTTDPNDLQDSPTVDIPHQIIETDEPE